jgi:hypothetical protein
MDDQDWEQVVVRRRGQPAGTATAGSRNKVKRDPGVDEKKHLAAIDSTDGFEHKPRYLPAESVKALVSARMGSGKTQEQLDVACNFPKHTTKGLEARTIVPRSDDFRAIARVLHVDLKAVPKAASGTTKKA